MDLAESGVSSSLASAGMLARYSMQHHVHAYRHTSAEVLASGVRHVCEWFGKKWKVVKGVEIGSVVVIRLFVLLKLLKKELRPRI